MGWLGITQKDRGEGSDEHLESTLTFKFTSPFTYDGSEFSQYNEKYQELLEQVNDIVFRMSIEGRLTEVSPSVTSILGYTPEEIIGKDIQSYLSPDSLDIIKREMARKIHHPEETSRYEIPIQAQDGETVICEVNSRLIKRQGRPLEILGIIRDTTERRQMEDTIRTSERKYRTIFENAVEGMFRCSPDGQIFDVNISFAAVFGYSTPEELINQVDNFNRFYRDPKDRRWVIKQMRRGRVLRNVQIEVIHKSGESRWIRLNASLVHNQDSDSIEGSVMDITEQVLLEKRIEEKDLIYHLLADNITDVIWTADMDMNLTYMSPSIFWLRGVPVEAAALQPLHEVYTPESLDTLLAARTRDMERLLRGDIDGKKPQYLELGMYHHDGHVVWTETVISLIFSNEHIPNGVVGSIRDISSRKEIERAHRENQVRLKEAQKLAKVGDWEMEVQTGCMTCSDELFRIFEIDRSRDLFSYERYISSIHQDDCKAVESTFSQAIGGDTSIELIHRIEMTDGRIKHLHVRGRLICSGDGIPEKIIGTMQDISERMSLEEERSKLMNQIQRNIAELSILNDGIRNPLAIIETALEIGPTGGRETIQAQIARIDAMITQLDKRWAESEKIFTYLQKHYGISS